MTDEMGIVNSMGPALGAIYSEISHPSHLRQQEDFQELQIAGQKELGDYNNKLAKQLWDATNVEAQVEHMKKAGLNIGLMYKSNGGGGTTSGSGVGNVTGGQAPNPGQMGIMGMQMMEQIQLLKAQKEKTEAETQEITARKSVNEATVPKLQSETARTGEETENIRATRELIKFNSKIADYESRLKEQGFSLALGTLDQEYKNLVQQNELSQAQEDEARAKIVNLSVDNALKKSNIKKNDEEINVLKADVKQILTGIEQRWFEAGTNAQAEGVKRQEIESKLEEIGFSGEALQDLVTLILGIAAVKGMKGTPQRIGYNKTYK